MKKLLFSFIVLGITSVCAIGATTAYFSDTETSSANTFTAGTLDLKVNGGDADVSYTFSNMSPERSQPNMTYILKNNGTLNGFLNIKNIVVSSGENGITEPELVAGDVSADDGELDQVLNLRLMYDANCNGWYESSDAILYQGFAQNIISQYLPNINIVAGQQVCINVLINWWSTASDNLAQGDDMTLGMAFELNQIAQ